MEIDEATLKFGQIFTPEQIDEVISVEKTTNDLSIMQMQTQLIRF